MQTLYEQVHKERFHTNCVFLFSDMPVDVHNDLFLSASLIGEAMQSMVTTVSRKTGNGQLFDILQHRLFLLKIGHVRYTNILTWLCGFQDKRLYLVSFSLYPSIFWGLIDQSKIYIECGVL